MAVFTSDIVWKDCIEEFCDEFLRFFLPELSNHIDFSKGFIFLDKELIFNSIKDACLYFKRKSFNHIILQHACDKYNVKFEILKTQKKRVKLSRNNKYLYFNSAGECDRHLNLWRGCTSNSIKNLNGNLFEYRAEYVL